MRSFRLWIYNLIVRNLPETRCFSFKAALLRWCGVKVGKNVRIGSSVRFSGVGHVELGDDVWIGAAAYIQANAGAVVTIGDCCDVGPHVMLVTGSHEVDVEGSHIAGRGVSKSIIIGDGCWLGARSTILCGVHIPEKSVVAAGAVVVRSVDTPRSLIAGVPACVRKVY